MKQKKKKKKDKQTKRCNVKQETNKPRMQCVYEIKQF